MIRAVTSFKPNYTNANSLKEQNKSQVRFGSYTPLLGNGPEAVSSRKVWGDRPGARVVKPVVDLIKKTHIKKSLAEGKSLREAEELAEAKICSMGTYDGNK